MCIESLLSDNWSCVRSEMEILLFLRCLNSLLGVKLLECVEIEDYFSLFSDICLWGFSCCSSCKNSQFWSAFSCHIICQVSQSVLCTMWGINSLCNIITIIAFCLSLIFLWMSNWFGLIYLDLYILEWMFFSVKFLDGTVVMDGLILNLKSNPTISI